MRVCAGEGSSGEEPARGGVLRGGACAGAGRTAALTPPPPRSCRRPAPHGFRPATSPELGPN